MFVSVAGLYCVYLAKLGTYFLQFCSLNGSNLTKGNLYTMWKGKMKQQPCLCPDTWCKFGPQCSSRTLSWIRWLTLLVAAGPTEPPALTRPGVWADLWPRMPALRQTTYIIQTGGLQMRRGRCRLQGGRNLGFRTPCGFQCIGAPPVLYIHLPFLTVSPANFRPRARCRGHRLTRR